VEPSSESAAADEDERRRRVHRISALAAMVAGLLAAALLALVFTGTVKVEPQARGKALGGPESEQEIAADGEDQR
jgi:hypothetical protein